MLEVDHSQAILFRILSSFFGRERVIPHMSVMAVCGGDLPVTLSQTLTTEIEAQVQAPLKEWGKRSKCLFTIVNDDDDPKMVVELAIDTDEAIDVEALHRQRYVEPIVAAAGVNYVLISDEELRELCDPSSSLDIVRLLKDRFGIHEAD